MSNTGQEIEAKFFLLRLDRMIARLQELQARLIQPRVFEINLRFDLPDGSLRSDGRVLRLRHDTQSRLTYKGASQKIMGILGHEEIEFVVDDFDKARQFLEALGYHETMYYEKYRATYELDCVLIMLDELPFGQFIEIEGKTVEQIQAAADRLGLDRNEAIGTSYVALFERICKKMQLSFERISFDNFNGVSVTPDQMDVGAADK